MTTFESFAKAPTALLTSYRRDGTPVTTPVNVAVADGRAFFRTYDRAGKFKRIRRDPAVTIRPATWRNRPTGPTVRARARLLDGDEAARASRLIAAKHRLLQGVLVPFGHRLRGYRTVHFELVPNEGYREGPVASAFSSQNSPIDS
jgi:PPOX class probable F420-dependent enzyme